MSRLLRTRAWSVLALLAGITSLWPGDVLWLRLTCAAGLGRRSRPFARRLRESVWSLLASSGNLTHLLLWRQGRAPHPLGELRISEGMGAGGVDEVDAFVG